MQSYDIPLHDIKPIIEVNEYSLYYLLGLGFLVLLALVLLVFLIIFIVKKIKTVSIKKEYKGNIESLDLKDTKNTAYLMSTYGNVFKDDSPEHTELFETLTQKLAEYKYKKSVDGFDSETLELIEKYKDILRV